MRLAYTGRASCPSDKFGIWQQMLRVPNFSTVIREETAGSSPYIRRKSAVYITTIGTTIQRNTPMLKGNSRGIRRIAACRIKLLFCARCKRSLTEKGRSSWDKWDDYTFPTAPGKIYLTHTCSCLSLEGQPHPDVADEYNETWKRNTKSDTSLKYSPRAWRINRSQKPF